MYSARFYGPAMRTFTIDENRLLSKKLISSSTLGNSQSLIDLIHTNVILSNIAICAPCISRGHVMMLDAELRRPNEIVRRSRDWYIISLLSAKAPCISGSQLKHLG